MNLMCYISKVSACRCWYDWCINSKGSSERCLFTDAL